MSATSLFATTGGPKPIPICISVPAAQYPQAGTYTDTVTATLTVYVARPAEGAAAALAVPAGNFHSPIAGLGGGHEELGSARWRCCCRSDRQRHRTTTRFRRLRLELSAKAPATVLQVINRGDAAATMQVQQRAWVQRDGRDEQDETRDLIISPAIFTFKPGETQVVRIALRGAPARAGGARLSHPRERSTAAPCRDRARGLLVPDRLAHGSAALRCRARAANAGPELRVRTRERSTGGSQRGRLAHPVHRLHAAAGWPPAPLGPRLHGPARQFHQPGASIGRSCDGRGRAGGSGQQCRPDPRRRPAALGAAPRPPSRFQPPSPRMARRAASSRPTRCSSPRRRPRSPS